MVLSEEAREEFESLMGKIIAGRFRVLEPIGEGSMGVVALAEHTELGNPVAIKVLRGEFVPDDLVLKRFRREARAASRISHRNIVYISDFGQLDDGRLFIVMEFIEGLTLRQELDRDGAMGLSRALRILIQIADALDAAHTQSVIHRDLKPENIILMKQRGRSDIVKILDFGLAKIIHPDGEQSAITQAGQIFGTPAYMSPEQCSAQPATAASDLYALGVLAFELAVGRVPFIGHLLEVMVAHRTEDPPAPSAVRPDLSLPAEFDAFVNLCLRKVPEDRFGSTADAQQALVQLREQVIKRAAAAPRVAAGDEFAKAPTRAVAAAKAPKRAEGTAANPIVAANLSVPTTWSSQVARATPSVADDPSAGTTAERRRYLTQLKRVAELMCGAKLASDMMQEKVDEIHRLETKLFEIETDAAVFETWAEEVEQKIGGQVSVLRNAVIELGQLRDQKCETLQVSPEMVKPTPLRGPPQSADARGREWEVLMDVCFQIRELEWRMAALEREQKATVAHVNEVLADVKADLAERTAALDREKHELEGPVAAARPLSGGQPALKNQYGLLDQLLSAIVGAAGAGSP